MRVPQLLDEVHRLVPEDAPLGTRCKVTSVVRAAVGEHDVAVAARIDAQGNRREQFWCDDVRVDRAVLLRLTCPEGQCPHVAQVRAQWEAFRRKARNVAKVEPLDHRPLMAEATVSAGGQSFTARPARFPCFTRCPNGAHPPLTLQVTGYDLFDDSGCVGGGVTVSGDVRRPRLPSLRDAQAYVLARHLEAQATVGKAREGPGPMPEAD